MLDPTTRYIASIVTKYIQEECQNVYVAANRMIPLLRHLGLGKIQTITFLSNALSLPVRELKEKVDASTAWSDRKESDQKFHESLREQLDRLGFMEEG